MALQCGIVGLPNVGKSTLFNCLSNAKAQAANPIFRMSMMLPTLTRFVGARTPGFGKWTRNTNPE